MFFPSTPQSCAKCNLYDVPLAFTTSAADDYVDKVVVFQLSELDCIRPYSQYVYFAERVSAAGVLFISDNREAHLETLGPEVVHHEFLIPSYVIPAGAMALSDVGTTYTSVQFPTIVNGVAAETIGAVLPPDTPLDDSAMQHETPGEQVDVGLSEGVVAAIVLMSGFCCCILGWKSFKLMNRRRMRGKLHAIGRMTHSHETQTFASLDALGDNDASSGGERYLTANSDNFVGISMQAVTAYPSDDRYASRRDSGTGRGSGSSKDAFEVTATRADVLEPGPKQLHLHMSPKMAP
jgi:hypothetical protein